MDNLQISKSLMQAEKKIISKPLNFCVTSKNNVLYGAALTLAWKELKNEIIKQDIQIQSQDQQALEITQKYNKAIVSKTDLSPQCYYAASGYGNATVNRINKQVSKKFPDKTTQPITPDLTDFDIIAYAYFLKQLKFQFPFQKSKVKFNGDNNVSGFIAKSKEQKEQIAIHFYKNEHNFIVQLKTTAKQEEIYLMKSEEKLQIQQISSNVENHLIQHPEHLQKSDLFEMPIIDISHKHSVKKLTNKTLANKNFSKYIFSQIYEIIKLKIDETGVTVQNQGVIKLKRKRLTSKELPKHILINGPFWIVMREKGKQEYFIAYITEPIDKD